MNTIVTIDESGKVAVCTIPLNRKLWNLPPGAGHRVTIFDKNVSCKSNPLELCEAAGIKIDLADIINVETYVGYRRETGFVLYSYQHEIDLTKQLDQAHGLFINEYSYFDQAGEHVKRNF